MPRLWNLSEKRLAALMTLSDLAEKSGVSRRQIVELEAGRASAQPRTARRLAAALWIEPRSLVGKPPGDGRGGGRAPELSEDQERRLRRKAREIAELLAPDMRRGPDLGTEGQGPGDRSRALVLWVPPS